MIAAPLALIPGWGARAQVWEAVVAHLSEPLAVQLLELPGVGGTPGAAGDTLAHWADALAARLTQPVVLCGWSLGAMVAMEVARRHPALVEALVLIAATPRFVACADWPHGLDPDTVARFRAGFATDPQAILRRFRALQVMGDSHRRELAAALESCHPGRSSESDAALAEGLRILAASDLRPCLGELVVRTRIVHGANDGLMPEAAARWLADALPDARLTVLQDSGHAVLLSRPHECAVLIESFLDG